MSCKLKTATILKKAIFGETILNKHVGANPEYGKNTASLQKNAGILQQCKEKFDKILLENNGCAKIDYGANNLDNKENRNPDSIMNNNTKCDVDSKKVEYFVFKFDICGLHKYPLTASCSKVIKDTEEG